MYTVCDGVNLCMQGQVEAHTAGNYYREYHTKAHRNVASGLIEAIGNKKLPPISSHLPI